MGAKSTIYVTRERLFLFLMKNLFTSSDYTLERVADILLEDRLVNVSVDPGGEDDLSDY